MNVLQKIRIGFADVKAIFTQIPGIIADIKRDKETSILKKRVHQVCDSFLETYADTLVVIAKKVDLNLLQHIVEDLTLLAGKYQEPVEKMVDNLEEAMEPVLEKYKSTIEKSGTSMNNIMERISKRHKWKKELKLPSEVQARADNLAKTAKILADNKVRRERLDRIKTKLRTFRTEESYQRRHENDFAYPSYEDFITTEAESIYKEAHEA